MGIMITLFDNVYFIILFYFLAAVFLGLLLLGIIGFLRMNRTTYFKCPKCEERLSSGVIVCKACGVNLNSIQNTDKERSFMRKLNDYLNGQDPYKIRNLSSLVLLVTFLLFIFVSYLKS